MPYWGHNTEGDQYTSGKNCRLFAYERLLSANCGRSINIQFAKRRSNASFVSGIGLGSPRHSLSTSPFSFVFFYCPQFLILTIARLANIRRYDRCITPAARITVLR
jgi:hypothetical protein